MQRGEAIAIAQLLEHVFHQRRFEYRIRGAHADADIGEPELDFPAIDWVEHARHVSLLYELTNGDRHRGRRDAHVIREIAEHHRTFGIEVVHDADVARAHVHAALRVANVSPVTREVDARVVAKHAGDVVGKAHAYTIEQIVSFVNTNNSFVQATCPLPIGWVRQIIPRTPARRGYRDSGMNVTRRD
jgi:hypothetical protein